MGQRDPCENLLYLIKIYETKWLVGLLFCLTVYQPFLGLLMPN